jgi:UPF0716 protein FxsA
MRLVVIALVLGLPIAELTLLVLAGDAIGAGPTLGLLALAALAGILILRGHGPASARRVRDALRRGEAPVAEVFDTAAIFLAGVLLIIPGFITDLVAILLLLPPVRALLRVILAARLAGKVEAHVYARTKTIDGDFHEVGGTLPRRDPEHP